MEEFVISKKKERQRENIYRTMSIRIDNHCFKRIEALNEKSERSKNEIIQMLLNYALPYASIEEE